MIPSGALFTMCKAAVKAVTDYYQAASLSMSDRDAAELLAPFERAGVGDSDSTWDCEGLTVVVERVFVDAGNSLAETYAADEPLMGLRAFRLSVWLLRCVPDLRLEGETVMVPTTDEVEKSARLILGDATMVPNAIIAAHQAGTFAGAQELSFEEWLPAKGSGIGGGTTRFRCQLLPVGDGT